MENLNNDQEFVFFCDPRLHNDRPTPAAWRVQWGTKKHGLTPNQFAVCDQHLGHAIQYAQRKRKVLHFRIIRVNPTMTKVANYGP